MSSTSFQGQGGVRHELFDSLASTLDAHGSHDESASPSSSGSNDRYGLGLREDYTKRLGGWGRLTAGAGIIGDHEDHNSSGGVLMVSDESHILTNTPAFLNNPRVITTTIQVDQPTVNLKTSKPKKPGFFPVVSQKKRK